jgi:hypothetical protein
VLTQSISGFAALHAAGRGTRLCRSYQAIFSPRSLVLEFFSYEKKTGAEDLSTAPTLSRPTSCRITRVNTLTSVRVHLRTCKTFGGHCRPTTRFADKRCSKCMVRCYDAYVSSLYLCTGGCLTIDDDKDHYWQAIFGSEAIANTAPISVSPR